MNVEDLHEKTRMYRVECWEPPANPADKSKWGRHWQIGVACGSAVEAVAIVQAKRPTYRIDAVNQCGVLHFVSRDAFNG
jgi:hypothetical protein